MASDKIIIRGAREHNLKNINVEIPRDQLVVITGLSGSGKSSLAFDTIYAEGQRRYVESLSAYARQFLEQMEKPDVDTIEGLSPAISIEQKTTSKNPRSTVGTVTEIHDYLRLLFARVGRPHCPQCGKEIKSQTVQQIVDQVMALPPGTRLQILSPVDPRTQRGIPQRVRTPAQERLRPGQSGRDDPGPERRDRPGQEQEAHHRGPGGPAGGQGRGGEAAGRFSGHGPQPLRGDRQSGDRGRGRTGLQRKVCLRGLRNQLSGDQPPYVLLQQPLRGLPPMRRTGNDDVFRPGPDRSQQRPFHPRREPSSPGRAEPRCIFTRPSTPWPSTTTSTSMLPSRPSRPRCRK